MMPALVAAAKSLSIVMEKLPSLECLNVKMMLKEKMFKKVFSEQPSN